MGSVRINNVLLAVVIGIIIAVTAYSVYSREPQLFNMKPVEMEIEEQAAAEVEAKDKSDTDRMIESGALSDHPAMYYRNLEDEAK